MNVIFVCEYFENLEWIRPAGNMLNISALENRLITLASTVLGTVCQM